MQQGRHPGIVPLLQTYLRADPPCLEYEYIAGGDLAGLIQEQAAGGGASPQFAAQIIHRLAQNHRLRSPSAASSTATSSRPTFWCNATTTARCDC